MKALRAACALVLGWLLLAGAPARAAPAADLEIAIALSGTYQVGKVVTYTVTVKNNGPADEAGTITVGGTVASGLQLYGISGNGWTCTANATLGTCSYTAGLVAKATAPALSVSVYVQSAGEKTVTATVTGTNDDKSANNKATHTAIAYAANVTPPAATTAYALTESACAVGATLGDAATCPFYKTATTAGRVATIHLTAGGSDGKAKAPPAATVSMQFALRCLNPATPAGIKAVVGASVLPECAPQSDSAPGADRWSAAADVSFAAGQASAPLRFRYADVGQVELHLRQGGTAGTPALFVSKPSQVVFKSITRGGVAPTGSAPESPAFAMAGEALLVVIGARVEDADKVTYAPNFGKEATRPALALKRDALHTDASRADYLPQAPAPVVDNATWQGAGGSWSVNVSWGEAGATTFTLDLPDYLAAGTVTPARQDVGRFVPAYFTTEITAPIACGSGIACPARPADPIGVAFSGQPFAARVVARGIQGKELHNFRGPWLRTVNLSAVDAKGAAVAGILAPAQLTASGPATLTHTLPNPYKAGEHRGGKWSAPTSFYLRAQALDGLDPKGVTSDRSPGVSDEDGLVVVSGRLRVANALGTDMLRTPLALRAEYWSGSAWLGHPGYTEPLPADPALARFTGCTRTLAGTTTPCDTALVGVSTTPPGVALKTGGGVLWLRAPGKQGGKRRDGSVGVQFDAWSWLPSTLGRVNFGSHRSPLIYVREVY